MTLGDVFDWQRKHGVTDDDTRWIEAIRGRILLFERRYPSEQPAFPH